MKNKLTRALSIIILLCVMLAIFASADGEYISSSDPLVSLSYVNDVLGPEIMANVMKKVEAEYVKIEDISSSASAGYTPVSLKKGQVLMAKGVVEVILLDGQASALVTSADNIRNGNGISDLTSGSVLANGDALSPNHYMVIPKADGRGFVVSSDTANILIRGEYNIAE